MALKSSTGGIYKGHEQAALKSIYSCFCSK